MSITRRRFAHLLAAGITAAGLPRHALAQASEKNLAKSPAAPAAPRVAPAPRPRLGINVGGAADWSDELPMVDVFRFARPWLSQRQGAAFGAGPKLVLDKSGWVKKLAPKCIAETFLCTIASVPVGEWTVLYEGKGTIEMWGEPIESQRLVKPGHLTFTTKRKGAGFVLRVLKTDPKNYVRNIRVLMPGFDAAAVEKNPWNPTFLKRWEGMAAVRYMDMLNTNNSKVRRWAERARPDHATFAERGVALELVLDLANRLQIDPWLCIPHQADDDYVRRFAKLVKQKLDPKLCAYIEYSNEVWNAMFEQYHYAYKQGTAKRLAKGGFEANPAFYARRATEVFKRFEQVFGGTERLVRVLASQAANAHVAEQIAGFENAARHADALAIAPYISCNVHPKDDRPTVAEVKGWSHAQLFDYLEKTALPECIGWMKQNKEVADKHGLRLVCYEAGQHLVGVLGAENEEAVTKLLTEANRDPRMGALYRRYYQAWTDAGGDLLCHFSSIGSYGKWGSWGLLESHDSDPAKSPKFVESMRWAKQRGQRVSVP